MPILPPEVHRDALGTLRGHLERHRTRAHWSRIVGDRDTLRAELAAIRSCRRALRTHTTALAIAEGLADPRGIE